MNPELKAQIDIEIENAAPAIKEFLHGAYFAQTINTIAKVNRLTSDQVEAVELETILEILGMNDYKNFDEAIQKELGTGEIALPQDKITQIIKDINEYVFDQIRKNDGVPTENKVVKVQTSEKDEEDMIKAELRKIIAKEGTKQKGEIKKIEYIPPKPIDYDIYREKPEEGDKIIVKE
jgi:hypothetical protein